jgi:hypothetical protein
MAHLGSQDGEEDVHRFPAQVAAPVQRPLRHAGRIQPGLCRQRPMDRDLHSSTAQLSMFRFCHWNRATYPTKVLTSSREVEE